MRVTCLLLLGLFLQTNLVAQTQETPPTTNPIEQQLKEMMQLFGGEGMQMDTMILKGFNLDQLQDLGGLNLEELMPLGEGGDLQEMMKLFGGEGMQGMDMQEMMKLMEKSMQGMDMGNLEELLGPLMGGDMGQLFPQAEEKETPVIGEDGKPVIGEDGKPVMKKKKTKKTYKL